VASEEARNRLIKEGVPENNIKLFGIPIDPKFTKFHDRLTLINRFGLNPELQTVLIMGGGQGLGPIKDIVDELDSLDNEFQIMIVTGINKPLAKWLKERQPRNRKKMIVFEYVSNIDEIMEVASLVITKPGGLTTSEALAKGLPMVIINPIPGQEMNNAQYLLGKGAAVKAESAKGLRQEVSNLLLNRRLLFNMSMVAKEISRPEAAINIANLLLSINA
jgi:processive 1,2-diacylglycerol beta-glucosyltransferase